MFQMKEQDKIPEEKLSEVDTANLTKKEFGVVIIQIIKELGRRMDGQNEKLEAFEKELENIKNHQTDREDTINEMKNTLEGINCRLNDTEELINKVEDRMVDITEAEQ